MRLRLVAFIAGLALCIQVRAQEPPAAVAKPAASEPTATPGPDTAPAERGPDGSIGTPPPQDPAEDARLVLPDIIITSQKFRQKLEDVPASVSQIGGEFINNTGKTNFQDLAEYLPNVGISISHADSLFTIRGLSTQDTNPGFDPSVGTVVDGVFYGRGQFLAGFFHDLEHLEVLRGPQGTLFGKNTTAGVFALTTREPGPEFAVSGEFKALSTGERSIQPMINIPLGETLGLRISGDINQNPLGNRFNSFLQRPEGNQDVQSMRARLGYDAGHGLKLLFTGFHSTFGQNNNEFKFLRLTDEMRDLVRSYDPSITTDRANRNVSANFGSRKEATIRGVSGILETEVNGLFGVKEMVLSLIGGFAEVKTTRSDLDADFSPVPFIHDQVVEPKLYQQLSQEIRLNGKSPDLFGYGHGLSFVGGLYFSNAEYRTSDLFVVEDLGAAYQYCSASDGFCALGAPFPTSFTGFLSSVAGAPNNGQVSLEELNLLLGQQTAEVKLRQINPTYGVFTQFEYFFTPSVAFIGGLRYTYEEKTGKFYSHSDSQIIKQIAAQEDIDETTGNDFIRRIESDVAPKAGLKWKVIENVDLYATWGQAFKSGGFNGFPLNPDSLEYEREEATSYEFGIKASEEFLGGPVRISGAGFLTTFDNLQVSTFQGGNFIVLNAAKARSIGGEMDFRWRPPVLGGLLITASAGYAEATYDEYRDAPAIADSGEETQDLTGKSLPLAPRYTASFIPSYDVELTPNFFLSTAVEMLYRSERFLDVDNDPRKLQPDTTTYNARLTLGATSQLWAVTLSAQNLTDNVVYDQALNQPLAPGNIAGVRTDNGRLLSINLSVAFGGR